MEQNSHLHPEVPGNMGGTRRVSAQYPRPGLPVVWAAKGLVAVSGLEFSFSREPGEE